MLLAVAALLTTLLADATRTLPAAYTLQFENEWVRVVRVHYAPKVTLPAHAHTSRPTAYVYLNDGGPVVFRHIGLEYGEVMRPATRAGSFRLARGLEEVHKVDNLTDTPSDFLRVELKTQPADEPSLRGRFYADAADMPTPTERIQFENAQIRITRIRVAAGTRVAVITNRAPALLISLAGDAAAFAPAGREQWIASTTRTT